MSSAVPMVKPVRGALLVLLLAAALPVLAAGQRAPRKAAAPRAPDDVTVIYRCTDANGMLSIQNGVPCPKGQRSERQLIRKPAATVVPIAPPVSTPVTAAMPVPAAADATLPVTVVEAAKPGAPLSTPPPLFRCRTGENAQSYLSETDTPAPRCRAIPVINGSSNPTLPAAAAQAQCVMEQDVCERIADEGLCPAWNQQLQQSQAMVELGNPEVLEKATAMRDRAQRVMEQACAAK